MTTERLYELVHNETVVHTGTQKECMSVLFSEYVSGHSTIVELIDSGWGMRPVSDDGRE